MKVAPRYKLLTLLSLLTLFTLYDSILFRDELDELIQKFVEEIDQY